MQHQISETRSLQPSEHCNSSRSPQSPLSASNCLVHKSLPIPLPPPSWAPNNFSPDHSLSKLTCLRTSVLPFSVLPDDLCIKFWFCPIFIDGSPLLRAFTHMPQLRDKTFLIPFLPYLLCLLHKDSSNTSDYSLFQTHLLQEAFPGPLAQNDLGFPPNSSYLFSDQTNGLQLCDHTLVHATCFSFTLFQWANSH